jgi:hypothetical protein
MLEKPMSAIPLVLVSASLALSAPLAMAAERSFPVDQNGQIAFITPSRNVGCTYTPKGGTEIYEPADGGPELACDRIEPLYVRLILAAKGKAWIYENVGDVSCCSESNVLNYGDSWHAGPYSCVSEESGLTCRRKDGHGFFASRKRLSAN